MIVEEVLKNSSKGKVFLTKFLTLEEQAIVSNKKYNCVLFPEDCERKRALFNDVNCIENDFNISIIKISYNKKYDKIGHRDVLGSLMGLGIKRECIGDIIVDEDIYVYVIKEMQEFIKNNLVQIGKAIVDVEFSSFEELKEISVDKYIEDQIIVSSYRLDTIISDVCCLSREKAKQYISLKNVKINGVINTNPDYIVKIDDLISIHRFGRIILKEEIKKTKKDKYVLSILKTK